MVPHKYKVNTWWIKDVHGVVTGFLNGWAHQSLVFCFFFSAFTKSFQTAFGPLGPFQKTNNPTAAPRAPPPTSQLKLPLSVLVGTRGTACFVRTLHRKWCNLGRFSSFPISFPKIKEREKCKESQEYETSLEWSLLSSSWNQLKSWSSVNVAKKKGKWQITSTVLAKLWKRYLELFFFLLRVVCLSPSLVIVKRLF